MKKELVQRLPKEIIEKILSYTYEFQDKQMLEDIRNFLETRETLFRLYSKYWVGTGYETEEESRNWLINDLSGYANSYKGTGYGYVYKFYNIFMRNFMLNYIEKIEKYVKKVDNKNVRTQINIYLGLFSPKERNDVILVINEKIAAEEEYDRRRNINRF